ncbi:MAG: histidine kinase [Actinomycetota bacterium]
MRSEIVTGRLGPRTRQIVDSVGSDFWLLVNVAIAFWTTLLGLSDLVLDIGANSTELTPAATVIVVVASVALLFRRAHPMAVVCFISIARLAMAEVANTEIAVAVPAGIALYTAARFQSRRDTLIATAITATAGLLSVVQVEPPVLVEELGSEMVLLLLVLALAEVLRTNQARTEERIEAEATARVHAERLRIARDLHDIVGHSLSNIALQSGVAARLLKTDPDHAERALEIINDAGRSSLDELRSFLGLLRSEDEITDTHPTPDRPADLDGLFNDARAAGIELDVRTDGGPPAAVPSATMLAIYRIVQESLTNVSRHAGPVRTTVEIVHGDSQVELSITNQPGSTRLEPVPSTGVGILGMRERAEAIGGHLTAERRPTGEFRVAAVLPYQREEFSRPS